MPRTADRTLLPAALRARLDAGGVTNGEYHRLLPTFPDAALCDHAEVYAQHCTAASLPADPAVPEAYLHTSSCRSWSPGSAARVPSS